MESEELFLNKENNKIFTKIYRPGDGKLHPAIIMCHGFGANGDAYSAYAKPITDAGFIAVYFDFCGGGEDTRSDGDMTEMSVLTEVEELSFVMDEVMSLPDVEESSVFLMGESQGGFVAAYEAALRPDDVRGLVLFYPAYIIPDYIKNLISENGGVIPESYAILDRVVGKKYFEDALKADDIWDRIEDYKGKVLILHGDGDRLVPYEGSVKAQRIYENASLICMEGARHGFYDEDEKRAGELMIEFIKSCLP